MTRAEAIKVMREGKKVTHRYFTPEEWVTQQGGQILLEDGVKCSPAEFWRYRQEEIYNNDWDIWVDPVMEVAEESEETCRDFGNE